MSILLATRVVQTFEKVGYREIQPCEELMAELKITRIVLNIRKFAQFWSIVILLIKIAGNTKYFNLPPLFYSKHLHNFANMSNYLISTTIVYIRSTRILNTNYFYMKNLF